MASKYNIETCIFEVGHPPLVAWRDETIKKGGIVVPDVASGLIALSVHFDDREVLELREETKKANFIIYGAWIEVCLVSWTELMLGVYHANQIIIDLTRSFSKIETLKYANPQQLSSSERYAMLIEYSRAIVSDKRVKIVL